MKTVNCIIFLIISLLNQVGSQDQISDLRPEGEKLIQRIEFIDGFGRRLLGYVEAENSESLNIFCRAITSYDQEDINIHVVYSEKPSSIQLHASNRSLLISPVTDTVLICKVSLQFTHIMAWTQLVVRSIRPIRLFGGNAIHRGRLQVKSENTWLDVCDINFDLKVSLNGLVACRQLGFTNVEAVIDGKNFSTNTDDHDIPFYQNIFQCTGAESTLSACRTFVKRKCTGLNGATGLICQASPMRFAPQTQVLLSSLSDINPTLTVTNNSNSVEGDYISATCTLTVQLPRSQSIRFSKTDRWSVVTELSNNPEQWQVQLLANNVLQVSLTYSFTLSRVDNGNTFICIGTDNLSGLSKSTSKNMKYVFGLKSVEITQSVDAETQDHLYFCMADISDPPATYSWTKYYFLPKTNGTEGVEVSGQSVALYEDSTKNRYLFKVCCKAQHTIKSISYNATTCKEMDNIFKSSIFTTNGNQGQNGTIQVYKTPMYGCYQISAYGAAGGNHTTKYGGATGEGGSWKGGLGASVQATIVLNKGIMFSIVVGQHGGNSSEVSPSRSDGSIEDNAGAGGGGGTFIYTSNPLKLYFAAGGGGGASFGFHGVGGQNSTSGAQSVGRNLDNQRNGGRAGQPGESNVKRASYKGGVGAGWFGAGEERNSIQHGDRGASRLEGWLGGNAGHLNYGAEGGFGGGGGGAEDNGASGGGGGYSGGGSGTRAKSAGGGGGSFCAEESNSCTLTQSGNTNIDGKVEITLLNISTCRPS